MDMFEHDIELPPLMNSSHAAGMMVRHLTLVDLRLYMDALTPNAADQFGIWTLLLQAAQFSSSEEAREYARAHLMRRWGAGGREARNQFTCCLVESHSGRSIAREHSWMFQTSAMRVYRNTINLQFTSDPKVFSSRKSEDKPYITPYWLPYSSEIITHVASRYLVRLAGYMAEAEVNKSERPDGCTYGDSGPMVLGITYTRELWRKADEALRLDEPGAAIEILASPSALNMTDDCMANTITWAHLHGLYNAQLIPLRDEARTAR